MARRSYLWEAIILGASWGPKNQITSWPTPINKIYFYQPDHTKTLSPHGMQMAFSRQLIIFPSMAFSLITMEAAVGFWHWVPTCAGDMLVLPVRGNLKLLMQIHIVSLAFSCFVVIYFYLTYIFWTFYLSGRYSGAFLHFLQDLNFA